MKFDTNSLNQTYIRHFTNLGDLVSKPLCGTRLHKSRFRGELVLVGLQRARKQMNPELLLKRNDAPTLQHFAPSPKPEVRGAI